MANNGVLVKQKTKLLNQTDSLNMIKNVVRLGISVITYLRDLFSERAYDDVIFQGMTLKMLKRVDKQSDVLLNWLDQGIFDAIEKQYLQMLIFDINDTDDNTIECYKFTFSYNRENGTSGIDLSVESITKGNNNLYKYKQRNMNGKHNKDIHASEEEAIIRNAQRLKEIKNRLLGIPNKSSNMIPLTKMHPNPVSQKVTTIEADKKAIETIKSNHKKETAKKAKQLLETLVTLTSDLGPLPEKTYLSMKLLYYDEYTPADYQPSLFREPDEQDLISFQKKPDLLNVGALGTDHHALSVSINTTCTANRSWTVEELYEQLILIERKKNIQKSFSDIPKFDEQIENCLENDQMTVYDKTGSPNEKTNENIDIQNACKEQNQFIQDNGNGQMISTIRMSSELEHMSINQQKNDSLTSDDINDKQNEIIEIIKTSNNDNAKMFLEEEEEKEEAKGETETETEAETVTETEIKIVKEKEKEIVIEITTSEEEDTVIEKKKKGPKNNSIKNNNTCLVISSENKEEREEEIKRYILSKQIASKKRLRKQYKYTSDVTFSKILNSLAKRGILKHSKNGVYRFCDLTNTCPLNEKKMATGKQCINKREGYTQKETIKKIRSRNVKESIKHIKENNENFKETIVSQDLTKNIFNTIPQTFVPLTQENYIPLHLKENENVDIMNTFSFIPSNNEQDQQTKVLKTDYKENNNHIYSTNDLTKNVHSRDKEFNEMNTKSIHSKWLHESNLTTDMNKDFTPYDDTSKDETNSDVNVYECLQLKKKNINETEEKKEDTPKKNTTVANNDSNHITDSGNNSYSKAFNEIEKLYNDVLQSCKTTKYINKEIISKGLGIEPKLAKPLLNRLIKSGHVSKKLIKNKGHESFLYEPLQINYKRKWLPTNISKNNEICQIFKKIHM